MTHQKKRQILSLTYLTSPVPVYWIQYSCMDPQTKGVILVCVHTLFYVYLYMDKPKGGHGKIRTNKEHIVKNKGIEK